MLLRVLLAALIFDFLYNVAMPLYCSVLDFEQGGRRDSHPMPWLTDITLGESRWMYVEGHKYKNAALVVRNMIDVWSKNGIVLLNVSPRADGVMNQEQRTILKNIGGWMYMAKLSMEQQVLAMDTMEDNHQK